MLDKKLILGYNLSGSRVGARVGELGQSVKLSAFGPEQIRILYNALLARNVPRRRESLQNFLAPFDSVAGRSQAGGNAPTRA